MTALGRWLTMRWTEAVPMTPLASLTRTWMVRLPRWAKLTVRVAVVGVAPSWKPVPSPRSHS